MLPLILMLHHSFSAGEQAAPHPDGSLGREIALCSRPARTQRQHALLL